jgi:hypothetical protein
VQRLIEQPGDEGELFEGSVSLGRVQYHLSVYQHFSSAEGEAVPAHVEVEGRVAPTGQVDLIALHRRGSSLKLRLADGRTLDCSTTSHEGMIHSTGRGLYRE